MKRFYKDVGVAEEGGAFRVLLDGKPVKSPGRHVLAVPTRALADAIAAEWRAQSESVDPKSMPLTGLAMAATDSQPAERTEQALAYAKSDLLCYRAGEPAELAARQAAIWDPLLDWAATRFGARLAVATGIVFVDQPPEALVALEKAVRGRAPFELAALHAAAAIMGSLVLALALADGRLTAADAFAASRIDEGFQAEKWGTDAEAEARAARLAHELGAVARFLAALDA
ncbi:MAG TPA: ATP12 family protein [Rhizomicrobium sp.]|nr:ATP12 family protein [Rhizomicrobium sp.]